jgi:hypothetical protein
MRTSFLVGFKPAYYLIFLLLVSYVAVNAQECGTDISEQKYHELMQLRSHMASQPSVLSSSVTYFPLKIHIVRQDDGTGSVDLTEVLKGIAYTNTFYINAGIQFYICGSVHYINSTQYYNMNMSTEDNLANPNDVANAANIYFCNSVGSGISGFASSPGGSQRVFLKAAAVNDGSTLPHELGHFFGLSHTHLNYNVENVARTGPNSNCTTAGDGLCDTPADPYPGGTVDQSTCTFSISYNDPNGDPYAPDLDNIMGYHFGCSHKFSNGQYAVIKAVLQSPYGVSMTNCSGNDPLAPTNLQLSVVQNGIQLNWQDNSVDEEGFFIERSLDASSDFVSIAAVAANTTAYKDMSYDASHTVYYYRVRPVNSSMHFTNTANTTTAVVYCKPVIFNTCNRPVSFPVTKSMSGFSLTGAGGSMNNLNNGCSGYSDFSNLQMAVTPGNSYGFSVTMDNASGSEYAQNVALWLDANQDGVFDNSENLFDGQDFTTNGSITIPIDAWGGPTRLRLRSSMALSPSMSACDHIVVDGGEIEDYTLNIISTTTVKENAADKINVYVANEILNINGLENISLITVYSTNGALMMNTAPASGSTSVFLSLNEFSSGVYELLLQNANGEMIKKRFVVVR